MNVYHFSRAGKFEIGQKIELIKTYRATNKTSHFLDEYHNGLSKHGVNYVDQKLYPNLENSFQFSSQLLEYEFELVRRVYFSSAPSRFTSLFALKSLENLHEWQEYLTGNYKIYELKIDKEPEEYDASFLHTFPSLNKINNNIYQSFNPIVNFDNAFQYWDKAVTNNPQFELLIDLNKSDVTVIKQITF